MSKSLADFHIHTYFSGDSEEMPENIIDAAIRQGMKNICFTDHQDFDYQYYGVCFELEDGRRFKELSALKEKYSGKIDVGIGVELGLEPHLSDKTEEFAKRYPYDFIIGSAHLVNGVDPYYPSYFENGSKAGFLLYFKTILEVLDVCRDFDVFGHLDYVVRYAPDGSSQYSYSEFSDVIDEILKKLIHMGKGIEINTGGLRSKIKNTNPCPEIVKRYRELGGEIITIGSDAHQASDLGYAFERAKEILEDAGFSYYTIFSGRKPQFIKL